MIPLAHFLVIHQIFNPKSKNMKNILYLFLGLSIISCNTGSVEDNLKKAIKADIIDNAGGADIDPAFEKFDIEEVNAQTLTDEWYAVNNDKNLEKDALKEGVEELAQKHEARNPQSTQAKIWRWKSDRIKHLESKGDDLEYYVVTAQYTFNNPLLDGKEVGVTNVYLVDSDFKVMLRKAKDEFDNMGKEYLEPVHFRHELLLFGKEKDVNI